MGWGDGTAVFERGHLFAGLVDGRVFGFSRGGGGGFGGGFCEGGIVAVLGGAAEDSAEAGADGHCVVLNLISIKGELGG